MPSLNPPRVLRVLLDAQIDKKLKKSITGHRVWTARDQNLQELQDGALLDSIQQLNFDVLVTMDKSMQFQNQLQGRSFGVILLRAKSNRLTDLLPLVPALLLTIPEVKPGEVIEING
jgi:predicted nuclease of predicted toxin-antitoxin system